MDNKEFQENVYAIVRDIPKGYVLTYGMVATYSGRPQNSRLVGKYLSLAPKDIPAYRVVNHMGRTAPQWSEQIEWLKKDGVTFKENGCVNMKKHCWNP